jgi:hypothetical protein
MSKLGADAGASELFNQGLQQLVTNLKATKEEPHRLTHFQHLAQYFNEVNSQEHDQYRLAYNTSDKQRKFVNESIAKQARQLVDSMSLESKFRAEVKKVKRYIHFIRLQLGEREPTPANIRVVMLEVQELYNQHLKGVLNPPKITEPNVPAQQPQNVAQSDTLPPSTPVRSPANSALTGSKTKDEAAPKKLTALQLPVGITTFIAHALNKDASKIFEAICHQIRYENDTLSEEQHTGNAQVLVKQWTDKEAERVRDREARLKKRIPELTTLIAAWNAAIPKAFTDTEMQARDEIRGYKPKADDDYSLDSNKERDARLAAYNAVQGYVPRTAQIASKAVARSIQNAQSAPDSITKKKLPCFARQAEELPHDLRVELENAGIRPITSVKRQGLLGAATSLFSGTPYRTEFADAMPHAHSLDPSLPAAFPVRKEEIKKTLTPHFQTRTKLESEARATKAKAEKEAKEGTVAKAPIAVDDLVSSFKKMSLRK